MKRLLFSLSTLLLVLAGCERGADRPLIERAFLALPDDAFASLAESLSDASARETLLKEREYISGSNEDTRNFSVNYDTELPDELTITCFQDPVFCYVQMQAYKMEGKDDWFILCDTGEMIDDMPMKSVKTGGYHFNSKKATMEETGLQSEPYYNIEFYDPIASWPWIKNGDDVKSTHIVTMPWGYYIHPNITEESGVQMAMNSTPFALKYVWDGEKFNHEGSGPALLFVDCLAGLSVTEQPQIPPAADFPGCLMEMTSEEGYGNIQLRHYDLYCDEEHLVRLDPFPLPDDEGRYILMEIRVFSPRYKTAEGFGVGTLLKDIRKAETLYGMPPSDLILTNTQTEDGRAALSVSFEGFDAETLFITDAASADDPAAKAVEVLIRPIAMG
ncbi:MAG: hypothetical protein IKX37_02525 [Bacteroidales bacterium]|nr:hypothetical protein [Bacteroidales bacterium]